MADLGTIAMVDLAVWEPIPVTGFAPLLTGSYYGTAPIVTLPEPFPISGYSLAGTLQPTPCPDCPDCPDCPELPVGVIWAPGGRFGQERS